VAARCADDCVYEDVPFAEATAVGPEAIRAKLALGLETLERIPTTIHELVEDGDTMSVPARLAITSRPALRTRSCGRSCCPWSRLWSRSVGPERRQRGWPAARSLSPRSSGMRSNATSAAG
jgi:hypothetical protein